MTMKQLGVRLRIKQKHCHLLPLPPILTSSSSCLCKASHEPQYSRRSRTLLCNFYYSSAASRKTEIDLRTSSEAVDPSIIPKNSIDIKTNIYMHNRLAQSTSDIPSRRKKSTLPSYHAKVQPHLRTQPSPAKFIQSIHTEGSLTSCLKSVPCPSRLLSRSI
jgi:hypothetical protein